MRVTKLGKTENKACDMCRVRRARFRISDDELGALNMCEQCNEVLHDSSLTQTRIHLEYEPIRVAC